jgi:Tol biopolymer transport system component
LLGALALLCLAGPAGATFPGKNGRLVFAGTDLQPAQLASVALTGERAPLGAGDSPVSSPDGTKIAFELGDYPDVHLWVMNADGTGRTQTACDRSPTWAPDSLRLACVDGLAVAVVDTSTGAEQKIAEGYAPLWSPEGSWIAYFNEIDGLSIVHPDGTGDDLVSFEAYDAAWAPDDTKLVYTSREGEFCAGDEGEPHSVWVVAIPNGAPVELPTDDNTRIYDPSFSPDSTRVSYVENFGGPERCAPEPVPPDRLYVVGPDGSGLVRLPCEGDAAWAPDSTRLACVDASALKVVSIGGQTLTTLGGGGGPVWSPDGSTIAFAGDGVDVVRADGTGRRTLVDEPDTSFGGIRWLRDSSSLVYSSATGGLDREIFTSAPDGSDVKKLTNDEIDDYDPAWSPNGKRIVYVHDVPTKDPEDADNAELYVMNADGTHKRRLTRHPGFDWQPSWSPDGRRIAFVREYKEVRLDLVVLDLRTHKVRRLTKTEDDEWLPSWSPNGRWIAFVRGDVGEGTLRLIRPTGRGSKRLRVPGPVFAPTWNPGSRQIAYQRADAAASRPWIAGAGGGGAHQVGEQPVDQPVWSPDGRFLLGDGGVVLDVRAETFSTLDALKPYDPKSFDWQRLR